jgi:hypothetical protein
METWELTNRATRENTTGKKSAVTQHVVMSQVTPNGLITVTNAPLVIDFYNRFFGRPGSE